MNPSWYFGRLPGRYEVSKPLPDQVPTYGYDWRDFIRSKPVFDKTKLGHRLLQVIIEANETLGLDGEPVE